MSAALLGGFLAAVLPFTHAGVTIETVAARGNTIVMTGHGGKLGAIDTASPGKTFEWTIVNPPLVTADGRADPLDVMREIIESM